MFTLYVLNDNNSLYLSSSLSGPLYVNRFAEIRIPLFLRMAQTFHNVTCFMDLVDGGAPSGHYDISQQNYMEGLPLHIRVRVKS